ncbi:hypothetical protein EV189_3560 [Motilibacter rhizosphaerae]|uniref:Uncharacterized protein n=1 Tax=Motilibacter rhizosphaerae TaxID=598652 RepID=A0A4Q7NB81_9ACTN|nr:hypothetical protein [Motilibacter rhizosphaerae]RZS80080.1 hypothetical protein EV189_3560 [Motilibacter rhizosphaerae]
MDAHPPRQLPTGMPFTRAAALAAGWTQGEINRKVRSGEWARLRHGVFLEAVVHRSLPPLGQYSMLVRAHLLKIGAATVSHGAAAALLGLPVPWPLSGVELTSERNETRTRDGLKVWRAPLPPGHVVAVEPDLLVTAPARTIVDCARTRGFRDALVVADAALRTELTTPEELREVLEVVRTWRGSPLAARVLTSADGRSESPGETLLRVDTRGLGYAPVPQLLVEGLSGRWYRADLGLEELGVLLEFDGAVKYRADDHRVLLAEKDREDDLRAAGWGFVRVRWSELGQPERLRARIEAAAATSRRPRTAGTVLELPRRRGR